MKDPRTGILSICILAALASNAFLASSQSGPEVLQGAAISGARATGSWTVLSYMSGDNTLETELLNDLEELENIPSAGGVNIIVQLDRSPEGDTRYGNWVDTRRYRVVEHPSDGIGSERLDATPLGELNMDDPAVFKDFLVFGLTNYPADHYMLVLEGHASGPAEGLLVDDSSTLSGSRMMKLHDMGSALRDAVSTTIGRPLEILSFDLCWMGMAETAAEVMGAATYLMGSFDEIPSAGWPYDLCLPEILGSSLPIEDRLASVIDTFMDHYDPEGAQSYSSLAAVDLNAFRDMFLGPFALLSEELFFTVDENGPVYDTIAMRTDGPTGPRKNAIDRYVDLYQFVEALGLDPDVPVRIRGLSSQVAETVKEVIVGSKGGSNHLQGSRLFGIYYPTGSDEALYPANMLSRLTAWDEFVTVSVRDIQLSAWKVNWTEDGPDTVRFVLNSRTPSYISKVELETSSLDGGGVVRRSMTGTSGTYILDVGTGGQEGFLYRYVARTIWGSQVSLPPLAPIDLRFGPDEVPPTISHIPPSLIDPSFEGGQLDFFISDGSGIDMVSPSMMPRLEYRQKGSLEWYSTPLRAGRYETLRGIQTFTGFPSGMPPGAEVEYHASVGDVRGNIGRSPAVGEHLSIMFMGERFLLDVYRSELSEHGSLISVFAAMGVSFEYDSDGSLEGLDEAKGYVLIAPNSQIDAATAARIGDFHAQGGEVLLLMDPSDNQEVSKASVLLQVLDLLVEPDAQVEGYYPSNPDSELGSPLPSIYGSSTGSFVKGEGDIPVFYSEPPLCAALTSWTGKGRMVCGIRSILDDASLEKASNRRFAELIVSYLAGNMAPEVDVRISPGGIVGPGESLTFDLGASYDRDGSIVAYRLSASDGTVKGGTSSVLIHSFGSAGTFTVELTVEDDGGEEASTIVVVKVNRPPEPEHGHSPVDVHAGERVTFDYKGRDPDGDTTTVVWRFGDGFVLSGDPVVHVYLRRGAYTYTVTITDSNGLRTERNGTITVLNSPPVVIIDRTGIGVNGHPGNFSGSAMVTLMVSEGDLLSIPSTGSYDADKGEELIYSWDMGEGTVSHEREAVHRYYSPGPRTVRLNMTDGAGASSEAVLSVMVHNTYPSASFSTIVLGRGRVELDASDSRDDPWDLANMTYRWDLGDGTVRTTSTPHLVHDYTFGGTYRVELTVEDSDGASSLTTMTVTVGGITLFQTVLLVLLLTALTIAAFLTALFLLNRRLVREGKGFSDLFKDRRGGAQDGRGSRGLMASRRRGAGTSEEARPRFRGFSSGTRPPKH